MGLSTAIFVFGFLACLVANSSYPPTQDGAIGVGMFAVWFVGAIILDRAKKEEDANNLDYPSRKKFFFAIAIIPCLMAGALAVNGIADSSTASPHKTVVVSISHSRRPSIEVASWKSSGEISIPFSGNRCTTPAAPGVTVTVLEKEGALGIPWVEGITDCSP